MNRKIVFLDHDAGYSGSTVSLIAILKAFKNEGFYAILVTAKRNDYKKNIRKFVDEIYELPDNIYLHIHFTHKYKKVFSVKYLKFLFASLKKFLILLVSSLKLISKVKPDIIYINEYVLIHYAVAAKILKVPVITHIRSQISRFYLLRKFISKTIFKLSSLIISISKQEATQILEFADDQNNKVKIVREFITIKNDNTIIETEEFEKFRKNYSGKFIVLMIGGLLNIKGGFDLIKAVHLLIEEIPNIRGVILGQIDFKNDRIQKNYSSFCINYIKENNLENYIDLIPFSYHPETIISISDIVVSANSESHFSRPIIEAWNYSKPIISTENPHSKEFISKGENGLFYNSSDYYSLAERIKELSIDSCLREKLGKNGKRKVEELFDETANTKKIISFVKKMIK